MSEFGYLVKDAFPDSIKSDGVRKLFEEYMTLSNAASSHHPGDPDELKFAELFTEDGVYELGAMSAKGRKDIIKMREKLFPNIPSRHHRILKLYTYGSNEHELLAYGEVDYEHHHGGKADTHWASKYSVKQVGNELKFAHVHIVLDTGAQE